MRTGLVAALMLAVPVIAAAEGKLVNASTCLLSWTAPTTTTTGEPLRNLKEYHVWIVDSKDTLPPKPTLVIKSPTPSPAANTRVEVPCPQPIQGQKFFTVQGMNEAAQTSKPSDLVPFVAITTTVTPAPTAPVIDQTITVAVSGTGGRLDWVGIAAAGKPANAFTDWKYLNDSQKPPKAGLQKATIHLKAPAVAGANYVFLAADDTFTVHAQAPVTVVPPRYCPCLYVYHSTTGALDVTYADGSKETVTPKVVP